MPDLVDVMKSAIRRHSSLRAAMITTVIASIPALAQAQCALTNGSTGTTPWPTCTTWTGPAWPLWYSTAKPVPLPYSNQPTLDSLDINGDGLADLLYQTAATQATGTNLNGAALSTGTGFTTIAVPSNWPNTTNCYPGNFDGSGRSSIACITAGTVYLAASTGTAFANFVPQTITLPAGVAAFNTGARTALQSAQVSFQANPCLVMDVDGDGTDDLVCGSPASWQSAPGSALPQPPQPIGWGVYLSTGGRFTYQVWNGPSWNYPQTQYCAPGDFNGDGLKDLACTFNNDGTGTTWTMLFSTGKGWSVQSWTNGPNHGYTCDPLTGNGTTGLPGPGPCVASASVGDFDGDGIDDLAQVSPFYSANGTFIGNGSPMLLSFGGGKSGFKSNASWNYSTPGNQPPSFCTLNDMFGVGRSGVLCATTFSTSSTGWIFLGSTGSALNATNFSTSWSVEITTGSVANPIVGIPVSTNQMCVYGDFNGDGIKDIACNPGPNPGYGAPTGSPNWFMGLSSRPQ